MQSRSPVVRAALVAAAWLVATVLAGTIAWAAVSRLGRQGGAAEARPLTPAQIRAQLNQAGQPAGAGQGGPSQPAAGGPRGSGPGPAVTRLGTVPERVSRSWQLPGGLVGVACRGRAAHLLYAAPLDGWAYRLESWRRIISVEFTHAAQRTGFRAQCVGGVPARVAHDDHEHHSGGEPGE